MNPNVDHGLGTIDLIVGVETDPLVRLKVADYALRYIDGINTYDDFNQVMSSVTEGNKILRDVRKHNWNDLEYRLERLKQDVERGVAPLSKDGSQDVRRTLFVGALTASAGAAWYDEAGFLLPMGLGILTAGLIFGIGRHYIQKLLPEPSSL